MIIVRPVITEQSIAEAGKGKFTFIVAKNANKDAIKIAVEKQFDVHVTDVTTQILKGKRARFGKRRIETRITPEKKACVTLKKGEKIALFDIAKGEEK